LPRRYHRRAATAVAASPLLLRCRANGTANAALAPPLPR